jgi:hypothetical protein
VADNGDENDDENGDENDNYQAVQLNIS